MDGHGLNRPHLNAVCEGSSRVLGRLLGEALRDQIQAAIESLEGFESFKLNQPWWLPYTWYQYCSEYWACAKLQGPIAKRLPNHSERLVGIAEGAGVRVESLYLFHALEALAISLDHTILAPPLAACSTVATPHQDHGQGALVAHNLDGVALLGDTLVLREHRGSEQYRSLALSCAPLSGIVDGINEHGLAVTYNWVFATDDHPEGVPVSMIIDDALGHCRTVEEAIRRILGYPRLGGAIIMLADATGDVASLELARTKARLRRPRRGEFVFHTNQYRSKSMESYQISRNAAYQDGAPNALVGQRALESAERRDHRLRRLLRTCSTLDQHRLLGLMADHGPDEVPNGDTICMHGEVWSTQATIQLEPRSRTIRVSYGPTCEAQLVEFSL